MVAFLRSLAYRAGIVVGAGLFLWQLWGAFQAIRSNQVVVAKPLSLLGALVFSVLATAFQMMGWASLLRQFGGKLSWLQVLRGFSLSFLPRYIPGSVWGYLSRNEWLKSEHGIDYRVSNLTSILEVAFILFSGALVSTVYLETLLGQRLQTVILLFLCYGALIYLIRRAVVIMSGSSFPIRIAAIPSGDIVKNIEPMVFLLLVYVMIWLCHGAEIWFVVHSLGGKFQFSLLSCVFVFYVAWSAGFIILFVPAGLGVREITLSILLVSTIPYLSHEMATSISVFSRLITLLGEGMWILVNLLLSRFSRRESDLMHKSY